MTEEEKDQGNTGEKQRGKFLLLLRTCNTVVVASSVLACESLGSFLSQTSKALCTTSLTPGGLVPLPGMGDTLPS